MDSDSDSRGFALLDYDRDGWQDIALVNANNPLSQLFHNELGKFSTNKGGMIAVRFRGGSTSDTPSDLSNRDGYGAIVEATTEVAAAASVSAVARASSEAEAAYGATAAAAANAGADPIVEAAAGLAATAEVAAVA